MIRNHGLIASVVIAAVLALSGCASTGDAAASGQPSGPMPAYSGEPSAAAIASPAGPCTTKACIASDAGNLKGTVAKDNAVMTKVACREVTVKEVVSGTYTVHCTVTYSDGMVAKGIASVLLAGNGQVDWEPTDIISNGS